MGDGVAERDPCRERSESVEAFMMRESGVRRRGSCSREPPVECCGGGCCVGESASPSSAAPAGEAGMGLSCLVGSRSHSLLGRFGVRLGSGIRGGAAMAAAGTRPRPVLAPPPSSTECSSSNLDKETSQSRILVRKLYISLSKTDLRAI